jgi:hypothetical protein
MLTGPDDANLWDRIVLALAGLVALHCLLAPLLSDRVPSMTGEGAHQLLALIASVVSVIAVFRGWMVHQQARVFGWAIGGWAVLFIARVGGEEQLGEAGEILLTLIAVTCLVVTHQLNRSLAYWHTRE